MQGRQRRRNVFGFGGAADECMVGKNQCPEKHIVHICSRKCIFISVMLKLMGFPGKYWGGGGGGGGGGRHQIQLPMYLTPHLVTEISLMTTFMSTGTYH